MSDNSATFFGPENVALLSGILWRRSPFDMGPLFGLTDATYLNPPLPWVVCSAHCKAEKLAYSV